MSIDLPALCAEHGLNNAAITFYPDSERCHTFWHACLQRDDLLPHKCASGMGKTPEEALAVAVAKLPALEIAA